MLKSLAVLLLLGYTKADMSNHIRLVQTETPDNTHQNDVQGHASLTIEKVEFESEESVWQYWEKRKNGQHCYDLFLELKAKYASLTQTKAQFDLIWEEYSKNCHDKCIAPWVRCGDTCKLPPECCPYKYNLEYCDHPNHSPNPTIHAPGPEDTPFDPFKCVDHCCDQPTEAWCSNGC